jgi:hypothetical protein
MAKYSVFSALEIERKLGNQCEINAKTLEFGQNVAKVWPESLKSRDEDLFLIKTRSPDFHVEDSKHGFGKNRYSWI